MSEIDDLKENQPAEVEGNLKETPEGNPHPEVKKKRREKPVPESSCTPNGVAVNCESVPPRIAYLRRKHEGALWENHDNLGG